MGTITRRDIEEQVARRTGQAPLHAKEAIQAFFEEIIEALAEGNRLEFRNFGVFEVAPRRPRTGRNPRTGDPVSVPAKNVVTFRMAKHMKERISAVSSVPELPT